MRIPGLGRRSAEQILVETGFDMSRFPTHRHISSWAKLSPGNNESAGHRRSGWTGRGNPWPRAALVEAAWGAARSHDSYFAGQYHLLAARRNKRRKSTDRLIARQTDRRGACSMRDRNLRQGDALHAP